MPADINDVVRRLKRIKDALDKAWGETDDLLAELYGEDGDAEYEELYARVAHVYEDYLVRGSRLFDDAYWYGLKQVPVASQPSA